MVILNKNIFDRFEEKIHLKNNVAIKNRYGAVTKKLNLEIYEMSIHTQDIKKRNSVRIGSFGRKTGINGISDLDMLFIMPPNHWDCYKDANGTTRLLQYIKNILIPKYPKSTVRVDDCVVRVELKDNHIEVQPVFKQDNGKFKYPHTVKKNPSPRWESTDPKAEIDTITSFDQQVNGRLRRLCRMARAWKNTHNVTALNGLLIDTFAYRFLKDCPKEQTQEDGEIIQRFLDYLAKRPDEESYNALGSGQRINSKGKFQNKAREGAILAKSAIDDESKPKTHLLWRKLLGNDFPDDLVQETVTATAGQYKYENTEQFIENETFPPECSSKTPLKVSCQVLREGFRKLSLAKYLESKTFIEPKRKLDFKIENPDDFPKGTKFRWKTLNIGVEAKRRNEIRGQITPKSEKYSYSETTSFRGNHYVECYAILDEFLIGREKIDVPIE